MQRAISLACLAFLAIAVRPSAASGNLSSSATCTCQLSPPGEKYRSALPLSTDRVPAFLIPYQAYGFQYPIKLDDTGYYYGGPSENDNVNPLCNDYDAMTLQVVDDNQDSPGLVPVNDSFVRLSFVRDSNSSLSAWAVSSKNGTSQGNGAVVKTDQGMATFDTVYFTGERGAAYTALFEYFSPDNLDTPALPTLRVRGFSVVPCGENQFSDGMGGCPCVPGSEPTDPVNNNACRMCQMGQYLETRMNVSKCVKCPGDLTTTFGLGAASISECVCRNGTYQRTPLNFTCIDCNPLRGSKCTWMPPSQSLPGEMNVSAGWWRLHNDSLYFKPCPKEGRCLGGLGTGTCKKGYTGPLCEVCADGYGRSSSNDCVLCKDTNGWDWFFVIVGPIGQALLVCYTLYSVLTATGQKIGDGAKDVEEYVDEATQSARDLSSHLKVIIGYLQMLPLAQEFHIAFMSVMRHMFLWQSTASNSGSVELTVIDCRLQLSFYTKLIFYFLLPILSLLAPLLVIAPLRFMKGPHFDTLTPWSISSIVLLFFVYPTVVQHIFEIFPYIEFEDHPRLLTDLRISYLSKTHIAAIIIGLCGILIYGLGIPALNFRVLYSRRHFLNIENAQPYIERLTRELSKNQKTELAAGRTPMQEEQSIVDLYQKQRAEAKAHFGFLVDSYEDEYWYWESIVMLRKAFLVGAIVFLAGHTFYQTFAAATVVEIGLMLHLRTLPYKTDRVDAAELASLLAISMTMHGALLYGGHPSKKLSSIVTGVLMLANVLAMIFFAYCVALQATVTFATYSSLTTESLQSVWDGAVKWWKGHHKSARVHPSRPSSAGPNPSQTGDSVKHLRKVILHTKVGDKLRECTVWDRSSQFPDPSETCLSHPGSPRSPRSCASGAFDFGPKEEAKLRGDMDLGVESEADLQAPQD